MLRYFSFIFIFLITNLKAYQIKYDPNIEDELSTRYSIRTICPIKEDSDDEAGEEEEAAPPIELNLTFEGPTYYDQGDTDACTFFARVCGMLLNERGRDHLQSLFLGQDDHFVYVKFPTPRPFGIAHIYEVEQNASLLFIQGINHVEFLRDTVFKVSKSVVMEHKPTSDFAQTPHWFKILAAAYHDAFQTISGEEDPEGFCTNDFQYNFGYLDDESKVRSQTVLEILTGKSQMPRINIKAEFEQKTLLIDLQELMGKPLLNTRIGLHHVRAICLSNDRLELFDSQSKEKGVVTSKMFDARVTSDQIKDFITRSQDLVVRFHALNDEKNAAGIHEAVPVDTQNRIDTALESCITEIKVISEQLIPSMETYESINISQLPIEEAWTRLYAEMIEGCFFGIQVLDL
jgi:hypothetical protein